MSYKILAINPGSTSTKVAVYEDEKELHKKNIEHPTSEIEKYAEIIDQYEFRYKQIIDFLNEVGIKPEDLAATVGRGGMLPPVKSGAYQVNEEMVDYFKYKSAIKHASNLGGVIAYAIANPLGKPAYIYDSVAVDEFPDIARISGLKEAPRISVGHALNMRAAAIKCATEMGKAYSDINLVVAHLGGGISVSTHEKGKMVELITDDEGPFSPERCGMIAGKDIINMCYENDKATMKKKLKGKGGLVSYFDTNDTIAITKRMEEGDKECELVLKAMAYQIAKAIGECATVVNGKVDAVVITGGIAYSKYISGWVTERTEFIAPVKVLPGENELEALSQGTLRVLKGEEKAHEFKL